VLGASEAAIVIAASPPQIAIFVLPFFKSAWRVSRLAFAARDRRSARSSLSNGRSMLVGKRSVRAP
jgi:hypothetical protein